MPARRPFNPLRSVLSHLQATLTAGILVVLPIGVTVWVFKFIFDLLDPPLQPVLRRTPIPDVPGLGLALLLVLVYLVGLVTAHIVGRRLVEIGHQIVEAIPVVQGVYKTIRTAVRVLSTPKVQPHGGVVLIDYPSPGLKTISLVTGHLKDPGGEEMLAVYVPTPPTTYSGFLVMVAAKDVTPTQMTVEDAMKIVISDGILAKDYYRAPSAETRSSLSGERMATDQVS